jgi:hypothetical protein
MMNTLIQLTDVLVFAAAFIAAVALVRFVRRKT